jgi:hypothetical protein
MFLHFFKKPKLRFITIEYSANSTANNNYYQQICSGKITGIILKKAFDAGCINDLKLKLSEVAADKFYTFEEGEGKTFPKAFSNVLRTNSNNLEEYIKGEESNLSYYEQLLANESFNFFNELCKRFAFVGKINVLRLHIKVINRYLQYGSYRYLFPNKGGIKIHVGNAFKGLYNVFYKYFAINNDAIQLSYFVLLKKPENGGKMEVFEALHSEYPDLINQKDLVSKKGRKKDIHTFKKEILALEEGDLLIFNGGNYWHHVTSPVGNDERISFGGFLTQKSENEFYIWT